MRGKRYVKTSINVQKSSQGIFSKVIDGVGFQLKVVQKILQKRSCETSYQNYTEAKLRNQLSQRKKTRTKDRNERQFQLNFCLYCRFK